VKIKSNPQFLSASPTSITTVITSSSYGIASLSSQLGIRAWIWTFVLQLHSTPESLEKHKLSLLAIAETVAALTVIVAISITQNSLVLVAWAAIIAPFLLLRTRYSTQLAIGWFEKLHEETHEWNEYFSNIAKEDNWRSLRSAFSLAAIYAILLLPVIASAPIRIIATLRGLFKYPARSIAAIPQNWYMAAFVIDSLHPAEVVAGYHRSSNGCDAYKEKSFKALLTEYENWRATLIFGLVIILVRILTTAYRFSLKATSIIYLPFLWIVTSNSASSAENKSFIDEIQTSEVEKIKRIYALVVFFAFTIAPLYLTYAAISLWDSVSNHIVIDYFFLSGDIDSWNITRVASATLTWFLFFYTDKIQIKQRNEISINERRVHLTLLNISRLRLICMLWTLFWGVYLTLEAVPLETLPGIRLLPASVVEWLREIFINGEGS
jgi:hypothetical protein